MELKKIALQEHSPTCSNSAPTANNNVDVKTILLLDINKHLINVHPMCDVILPNL